MGKLIRVSCLVMLFGLISCGGGSSSTPPAPPVEPPNPEPPVVTKAQKIETMWAQTIAPYMAGDLWTPINIYDAGHALIMPLHYAFEIADDTTMQQDFHDFFSRYNTAFDDALDTNDQSRMQFHYVASRYFSLIKDEEWSASQESLYNKVIQDLDFLWNVKFASQLGVSGDGRREILQWKLDNIGLVTPKFRRATFDIEFNMFTVGADIAAVQMHRDGELSPLIADIRDMALATFQQEVQFTSTGWLYQPGQWEEFEDYLYAGHTQVVEGLEPSPVQGIATDSSHSHRMPLWLISLKEAFPADSEQYAYFEELHEGFRTQFMDVVFVPQNDDFPSIRMTNYMDGNNGVYRYRFNEQPDIKLGYDPYNLSGTLMISFYPFLYDVELAQAYDNVSFPLPDNVVELYQGLGPAREANEFVTVPNLFTNGYAEVYSLMASLMVK